MNDDGRLRALGLAASHIGKIEIVADIVEGFDLGMRELEHLVEAHLWEGCSMDLTLVDDLVAS